MSAIAHARGAAHERLARWLDSDTHWHSSSSIAMLALAAPAAAVADPGAVIRDCSQDEQLDGKYSKSDLR